MKIGIVGGIGSGKSTVSEILKEMGYIVLDCDKIYNDISLSKEYIDLININFPGCVKNNQIDRKILGNVVFHNREKLTLLNQLAHPLVIKKLDEIISSIDGDVFVETQVIDETLKNYFDKIMLVTADTKIRIQRVMQRSGYDKEYVKRIIASQMNDSEFEKMASIIVINNKGKTELKQQLIKLLK